MMDKKQAFNVFAFLAHYSLSFVCIYILFMSSYYAEALVILAIIIAIRAEGYFNKVL